MRNGFTLVELVIVLAIITTLLVIATLNFAQFSRKSGMESQTKMIYADLMTARARALYSKQRHAIKFTPDLFSVYSSPVTTCEPVLKRHLSYPLHNASLKICFSERGFAETNASVCIEDSTNSAIYDSLVIFTTRIQLGKRKTGTDCVSDSIATR